jgi:predicted membrane protein
VSEDDFILLRDSLEAQAELMDLTRGDPEAFTEGSVSEVLARARAAVRGEAEDDLSVLREELGLLHTERADQRALLHARAQGYAHTTTKGALYASVIVFALLVFLTLPRSANGLSDHFASLIAPVIFFAVWVVAVLTLFNVAFGTTLRGLLQTMEISLARFIERRLQNLAGISEEA